MDAKDYFVAKSIVQTIEEGLKPRTKTTVDRACQTLYYPGYSHRWIAR
jgi:hypothetical protein